MVAALGAITPSARAQELAAPEYKIKAAFLYNFAKLTEWPTNVLAGSNAPVVIGVLGKDPFGPFLTETVRGKNIDGRKVRIVRFEHLDDVEGCQLLFVSASESGRLQSIFSRLSDQPVLTVGDTGQFARKGGMIGLWKQADEIRFDVNLEAVERAGLKLSSKLLRLAEIVSSKEAEQMTP